MTLQTRDQIREYAQYVDRHVEPIDIESLPRLATATDWPATDRRGPNRLRRRFALAFVVAAVLTLAVLVPVLILATQSEPDVATTVPDTLPSPDVTTPDAAPGGDTPLSVRDLPLVTDAGWTWVVANAGHPLVTTADGVFDPTDRDLQAIGRLEDGTWFAFDRGWDCLEGGMTYRVSGFDDCRSGEPVADPVEVLHLSRNGSDWEAVTLDHFAGYVTHATPYGSGPFFVTAWPAGEPYPQGGTTTWVTRDASEWNQVTVVQRGGSPDGIVPDTTTVANTVVSGETIVQPTSCSGAGYLAVSIDDGASFAIVDALPGAAELPEEVVEQTQWLGGGRAYQPDSCPPHRTLLHHVFTIGGAFHALQFDALDAAPKLWRSDDGLDWRLVGTTSGYEPLVSRLWGVVASDQPADLGDLALVAVPVDEGEEYVSTRYLVSDDGLAWTELSVPHCARARAGLSETIGTLPGPSANSAWVMMSTCGLTSFGHVVALYEDGSFTWYAAGRPEIEQAQVTVTMWHERLSAVVDPVRSGEPIEVWLAIPPE